MIESTTSLCDFRLAFKSSPKDMEMMFMLLKRWMILRIKQEGDQIDEEMQML